MCYYFCTVLSYLIASIPFWQELYLVFGVDKAFIWVSDTRLGRAPAIFYLSHCN